MCSSDLAEGGAAAIVLGVGGSATHDLGLGALAALGLDLRDNHGDRVDPPVPSRWEAITRIGTKFPQLPPLRIACDVTNPLLGTRGAAATFAPQKGLRPGDLSRLEHATARLTLMLTARFRRGEDLVDRPGAGAAGGSAFGLMTALGAELVPGFELVSAWLDLAGRLAAADLVFTGEGAFDGSTLDGKGPGEVIRRAAALGKPVHIFAGRVEAPAPGAGCTCHAITPPGTAEDAARRQAAELLQQAVGKAFG